MRRRPAASPWLAAAVAVAIVTLAACEQSGPQAPRGDEPLRVALLHPGPISDGSWNASAYDGMKRIREELGAEISEMQTATPSDFERGFRDYAAQGYDLVFGHGFEFQDAALAVAPTYPGTKFVVSSGSVSAENVASMRFDLGEATYLAGVVAASLSRTGKAGCIGGIKLPVIRSTFDGFTQGAHSVKPDFIVVTAFTGSFEDVAAAKAAADAMIGQGADMLIQNADAAGLGVFQSAKQHGILAFGTNRDQSDVAPETVVASAVISIPDAFVDMAREVAENRFRGRVVKEGLASGVIRFVLNPKLADRVPPEVAQRVADAEKKIRDGAIEVKQ